MSGGMKTNDLDVDFNVQLLTLTPDDQVVAIRIFHGMPKKFNTKTEQSDWVNRAEKSANELQDEIDCGYGNINDLRVVLNPIMPDDDVTLNELKAKRENKWIYKQLEKEQNIRTFTFDLIKYLNELGQNTNGLIATLSAIKICMPEFTPLLLKKHHLFVNAVLKIFEYLHFSKNLITEMVFIRIYELTIDVLRYFKKNIFLIEHNKNFHDEFNRIMVIHNEAVKNLSKAEQICLINDPTNNQ